jgi:caa(3)-type oxidase subunit IV
MSATHHPNYVKIWAVLCGLLVISIVGPMLGIRVVTLITAFGIAVIKAYLVARNFMHVNVQPRYVAYALLVSLAFIGLLFAGVSPDVMKAEGQGWTKPSYAYHEQVGQEAHAEEHAP